MRSTNLQTGQPADPTDSSAPVQNTLIANASEKSSDDSCWTCGLDRRGSGAAHDCIQALKEYNQELREIVIAMLTS